MLVLIEDILWLLVLIGVMINIHELGHFWAARFFDVKVEAFSFGFGPRCSASAAARPITASRCMPIGGYVKMAGEQPATTNNVPTIRAASWPSRDGSG